LAKKFLNLKSPYLDLERDGTTSVRPLLLKLYLLSLIT